MPKLTPLFVASTGEMERAGWSLFQGDLPRIGQIYEAISSYISNLASDFFGRRHANKESEKHAESLVREEELLDPRRFSSELGSMTMQFEECVMPSAAIAGLDGARDIQSLRQRFYNIAFVRHGEHEAKREHDRTVMAMASLHHIEEICDPYDGAITYQQEVGLAERMMFLRQLGQFLHWGPRIS